MPDPTGPVSTLPGSILGPPEGSECESCGAPATKRVQGETDSFGAEWNDLCDACASEESQFTNSGECDWCHRQVERRTHTRDYEEGLCGRVYLVCDPCLQSYTDRIAQEEDEIRRRFGLADHMMTPKQHTCGDCKHLGSERSGRKFRFCQASETLCPVATIDKACSMFEVAR